MIRFGEQWGRDKGGIFYALFDHWSVQFCSVNWAVCFLYAMPPGYWQAGAIDLSLPEPINGEVLLAAGWSQDARMLRALSVVCRPATRRR